jgi:diguanylate cyclase (GGDEF)-like protein
MSNSNGQKKLRIVLVEDDVIQADLISKSLSGMVQEIKWLRSGNDLLSYLESESCDFIFIDHHLPKKLGLEVIGELKKNDLLKIPTVILVEPGKEPVVVDALKLGVFTFVIKTGSFWLYLPGIIERGLEWAKQFPGHKTNGNGKYYLIDKLTNIPTERVFALSLKNEMKRSQRYGRKYSLLILDVREMNKINQLYGSDTGDRVLKSVASGIQTAVRGADMVCRHTGGEEGFSGDEFLVLLETDEKGKDIVIERLKSVIKTTTQNFSPAFDLDINIGCVSISGDVKNPLALALESLKKKR